MANPPAIKQIAACLEVLLRGVMDSIGSLLVIYSINQALGLISA
jgi:hypothetical protein